MIPEYCKQCYNRQTNPYIPMNFETNQTPQSFRAEEEPRNMNQNQPTDNSQSNERSDFPQAPGSPTILGIEYTQGYLKTIIGKRVRVTFLIGTDSLTDRTGILEEVGISFIVLRDINTGVHTMCDIYSIKFVDIFS
jgi:hypothetical protein